ncbi:hypothetical protein [Mesorhizobium sp. M1406]|uniref:hypothetical protein n=1 Tax=Mesorhizobium sp. M1406 TaxID=2957099 RepID=UPI00333A0952
MNKLEEMAEQFRRLVMVLREHSKEIQRDFELVVHLGRSISEVGTSLTRKMARAYEINSRIEPTGWLPHATTPFHLFDMDGPEPDDLRRSIGDFYHQHWPSVSTEFRDRLQLHEVDGEARKTFSEALDAHSAGYYRSVVRLLFPEIERVIRVEFEGAGIKEFRQAVDRLPAGYMLQNPTSTDRLYRTLAAHLYDHVNSDNCQAFASNPIPNRHAAMHGRVTYTTAQNSINTLIMADFVFDLVSIFKRQFTAKNQSPSAER